MLEFWAAGQGDITMDMSAMGGPSMILHSLSLCSISRSRALSASKQEIVMSG